MISICLVSMGRELTSRIAAPMSGLLKCPGASPWNGMTIPLNGSTMVTYGFFWIGLPVRASLTRAK